MRLQYLIRNIVLVGFVMSLFSSCVSREEIAYFQGTRDVKNQLAKNASKSLKIGPDDLLTISVSAPEQDAAIPFNLPLMGVGNVMTNELAATGTPQLQTYLVDDKGQINFPVLGKVSVRGLDRTALEEKLVSQIKEYVKDPIVNVRIVNFQVSVLGEVNNPGTFNIANETVSLPKALGLAGDMTIYGQRDNVLVVREVNGTVQKKYLDLTKAEVINSPFYYLKQNDIVYIEPNSAQRQGASYNRNSGIYISIASVLISLLILITR